MAEITTASRSESIAALAEALAKAQGEMSAASKDNINPHYKSRYADLASMWEACRGPLSKHGLAVLQPVKADEARVTVTTILAHSSGEWLSEALTVAATQNTAQAVGSAITYGRRYGLAAMVGIAPDDDDGNAATGKEEPVRQLTEDPAWTQTLRQPLAQSATVKQPPTQSAAPISDAQRKRFFAISKEHGWKDPEVKALLKRTLGVESSKQIPTHRYDEIVTMLQAGVDAMAHTQETPA